MTKLIKTIKEIREMRQILRDNRKTVGLVPTMGYLHKGHQSLIKRAKEECDAVIVSDFLNPLQFGPSEDLSKYPRDLEKDLQAVSEMGADALFYPSATEMYGNDFLNGDKILTTVVPPKSLTDRLCGLKRPGHFDGVCTVVAKLFNIVEPNKAYFGQKDAQQLIIINKMVEDTNRNIEVVGCPIIREDDGLAMSSRNIYLNENERKAALVLNKALQLAKDILSDEYTKADRVDSSIILNKVCSFIKDERLASIDYVSLVNPINLKDLSTISKGEKGLLALAVFIGEDIHKTRLIDNIILNDYF